MDSTAREEAKGSKALRMDVDMQIEKCTCRRSMWSSLDMARRGDTLGLRHEKVTVRCTKRRFRPSCGP